MVRYRGSWGLTPVEHGQAIAPSPFLFRQLSNLERSTVIGNLILPKKSTNEAHPHTKGAPGSAAATWSKLTRACRPTIWTTHRYEDSHARYGSAIAASSPRERSPKSCLDHASPRQMRQRLATKLFSSDKISAAFNTQIVSGGAGSVRHHARINAALKFPASPLRPTDIMRGFVLDAGQLDNPPSRPPVARLHYVKVLMGVHPDTMTGAQFRSAPTS